MVTEDNGKPHEQRSAFFGGLPERGIWTAVNLGRGEFLGILALSLLIFVFWDGPVWTHLKASHFERIMVSYAFIPLATLVILARGSRLNLTAWFGATLVIGIAKLFITALLVMLLGVAGL
jgi:hypothetical protein